MHLSPLFIQLIGVLGTILYFISFQCRSNRRLFQIQFLSYCCYTAHLLLLCAFTGGISYILNTIRSFCMGSRSNFLKSRTMCILLCSAQLVTLCITWAGWISILPVAANIASTIGSYTNNPRKIRSTTMFINSPLWILYDVLVGSWAGILDEFCCDLSTVISIVRFGWKNLDEKQE